MIDDCRNRWLAGVDGCAGGWIVAFVQPTTYEVRQRVVRTFSAIPLEPEAPTIIAVDMPIGLPDISPEKGRLPEREVRPLLGSRKSSVFRIPSRPAVYAGASYEPVDDRQRYLAACEIARGTSDDRKAFSKQGFFIFRKIVEVDEFLRSNPRMIGRVHEVHPEVAFWCINEKQEVREPKKKKNRPYEPGLELRRRLLIAEGFPEEKVRLLPPKSEAGADDWLDALAGAAIAKRISDGRARSYPVSPQRDAFGLPMAIWA